MKQFRSKDKDIEKYIYLSMLKEQDPHMFYRLCLSHMHEFTPIIYTPTVGQACQEYSHNYRRPEGLFVSIKDKGKIRSVLRAWPKVDDARISVVTDGGFSFFFSFVFRFVFLPFIRGLFLGRDAFL